MPKKKATVRQSKVLIRASSVVTDTNLANVSAPHMLAERQPMSMFKRAATRANHNQEKKHADAKENQNKTERERCQSTEFKKERTGRTLFAGASRQIQEDNYLTKSRISAHGSQGRCSSVGSIDEVARPIYMKK